MVKLGCVFNTDNNMLCILGKKKLGVSIERHKDKKKNTSFYMCVINRTSGDTMSVRERLVSVGSWCFK